MSKVSRSKVALDLAAAAEEEWVVGKYPVEVREASLGRGEVRRSKAGLVPKADDDDAAALRWEGIGGGGGGGVFM